MFVIGHTGLTLTVAMAADAGYTKMRAVRPHQVITLLREIDVRTLLTGSMLPDIIDKPLGIYLLGDRYSNGRIFAHSPLFFVVVLVVGFILYRLKRRTAGFAVAFAVCTHLAFDEMWRRTSTLLWPFFGWIFPREYLGTNWAAKMVQELLSSPATYIAEVLGGIVLLIAFVWLVRRKRVVVFIKKGYLFPSE